MTSRASILLCAALLAPACSSSPGESGSLDGAGATESGGAEGAESADGVTGPGSADGGGGEGLDPALCDAEGEADATFAVPTDHWPGGDAFDVAFDVQCEIVDMGDSGGATIEPTLECDLDGMPQVVTITMADPGLQTTDGHPLLPAFDVGQPVRFRHTGVQDAGGVLGDGGGTQHAHLLLEEFSLHRDDGHLLAAGFRSWSLPGEMYAPVTIVAEDELCGVLDDTSDPDLPMGMTFTLDGASIGLVSGQSGLLDTTGDGEGLSIAVEYATAIACCHTTRAYGVLMIDLAQGEG